MATAPYFVLGPTTILSIIGLAHGPDTTVPTPEEDWREAKVDVVIPAYNEEDTIILCLESLLKQTIKPNKVVLIDDGSTDKTVEFAKTFCAENNVDIEIIERKESIGKTPTLKREARELDCDVEFILDSDTILESENYIERTVEELYKGVGIASACGTVLPIRERDRKRMMSEGRVKAFAEKDYHASFMIERSFPHRLARGLMNIYREALYRFLQNFVYQGYMTFFGSIINPVGCAVAYRRKYLKDLFDEYEPILGDNLTNSEDIFIGFAMQEAGYRNIQLHDIRARSEEPEAQAAPKQLFMWSSAFLQSCYYFPDLVKSPFKVLKRRAHERKERKELKNNREVAEAYRQPFGKKYSHEYGRPIGWAVLLSLMEKILFPLAIVLMIIAGWWEPLIVTIMAETAIMLMVLVYVSKGHRIEMFFKGLIATPLRYLALLFDLFTVSRVVWDAFVSGKRDWRK